CFTRSATALITCAATSPPTFGPAPLPVPPPSGGAGRPPPPAGGCGGPERLPPPLPPPAFSGMTNSITSALLCSCSCDLLLPARTPKLHAACVHRPPHLRRRGCQLVERAAGPVHLVRESPVREARDFIKERTVPRAAHDCHTTRLRLRGQGLGTYLLAPP